MLFFLEPKKRKKEKTIVAKPRFGFDSNCDIETLRSRGCNELTLNIRDYKIKI